VEFVAVATRRDPHPFLDASTGAKRNEAIQKAGELHARFPAARIQFLPGAEGAWRFNFLLTQDGAVIGTDATFKRQKIKFQASHGYPPVIPPPLD
jgi:hypothetical protein